jgi:hypothetical protein
MVLWRRGQKDFARFHLNRKKAEYDGMNLSSQRWWEAQNKIIVQAYLGKK